MSRPRGDAPRRLDALWGRLMEHTGDFRNRRRSRVLLDHVSFNDLMCDHDTYVRDLGFDSQTGQRQWRGMELVVSEAADLKEPVGPAEFVPDDEMSSDPHWQVTIEYRLPASGRIGYLDDPDNSPLYEKGRIPAS